MWSTPIKTIDYELSDITGENKVTVDELVNELSHLGILDAIELVKKLEKRWGVSATQRIGKFVAEIIEEQKQVQEQDTFDVIMADCGIRKIEVIKVLRLLIPGLGLKEAKDTAENSGCAVFQHVGKEFALQAKKQLEKAGATIRIQ